VIAPAEESTSRPAPMGPAPHADARSYALAISSIAIVTVLGLATYDYVTLADITML